MRPPRWVSAPTRTFTPILRSATKFPHSDVWQDSVRLSTERLTGFIAGVFAVRAFDVGLSAFGQLVLPVGELSDRLLLASPSLVGTIVSGLISLVYLRSRQNRWHHVVAITLLALGIVYGAVIAATPIFVEMPNRGVTGPMIARGMIAMLFSALAIWMITRVMRNNDEGREAKPSATNDPANT